MECCFLFFFPLDSSFFEPAFNIRIQFQSPSDKFLDFFFFFWVYPKVLETHRWACECCCLSTLVVTEWPFFFLSFLERTNCFVLKVTWQVLLSLSLFSQENKSLDYLWFFFVLVFMTGVVHSMLVILHFVSNILSLSHNGFKLCSWPTTPPPFCSTKNAVT